MKLLSVKVLFLLLIGVSILPFISSSSPNDMYEDQVAVIMYHHLSDTAKSSVTITPKLFREQLEYLADKHYNFITLEQFKHYMAGGEVPDNAVLVTFDDGYRSFYDIAYPILKEMHIPAVNFIITRYLDNPDGSNIPFMTGQQLSEILSHPEDNIEFECHSDSLHEQINGQPMLTSRQNANGTLENSTDYASKVISDTNTCKNKLSQVNGGPVSTYAYPFGGVDPNAAALVHQAGIEYGFTTVSEMATRNDDPMQIPRITGGNPSITPEELHRTIMRKVVSLDPAFGYIPFRESVGQIGGTMIQDHDGTINFYYNGNHWTTRKGSSVVMLGDQPIDLDSPITLKRRHAQIQFNDLQKAMGIPIAFNPISKTFSERLTPVKQQ
ncbi:polysaccharide deacetylase family protein [Paenibacillus sp. OAS669]|uniref:polysaccharide deacetylase family protein n=1 Tax=Paenibacillus sp. OAS669 TaxID=2663821 RepID=UPI00178B4F69|nr:polysaccharide deacetylase family protein [Paenibacillus sp. OAS669]MBE1441886.1 peptidoglycan/xylan/chitin deacetylase (PgdA/CDA1 family) [Paenibacillus sp. OAS669]